MKKIAWFGLLYFILIGVLYSLGYLFPYQPSFLNKEYFIPVSLLYLVGFILFSRYQSRKK